ncbi:unnamed protein product [Candidula unifasciata]|uniref:Protein CDV3 homolog n=1 Tax=Candidula unifasciata TaxID=100452 RepID=A0A8S3ZN17_9EUPU|nr:unnamed protein product [Candidula unifasciata]
MADSSLDDFFAKKDKNKRKPKAKPEIAADIEAKKDKKKKDKDKENVASGGQTNVLLNQQEDEEWKDYEVEREVDYTGLRIQTLKMSKEDPDKEGGDGNGDGDDEDENKLKRDGASGPWNKSGAQASSAGPAESNAHAEVTKEEPVGKTPGKYVPPAQRLGASGPSSSKQSSSRKKKDAPNVNSEEDFPTLGGMPGTKKGWSQQYSSTVSSDLIDNAGQRRGVNLTLENKFSALQD